MYTTVQREEVEQELQKVHNAKNTLAPGEFGRHDFNCWGFTAYVLGWEEETHWLNYYEMDRLLEKYSVPVKHPRNGDIAVYRSKWGTKLEHTAIVTDGKTLTVVHKPGGFPVERSCIAEVLLLNPCYGRFAEYRRPI